MGKRLYFIYCQFNWFNFIKAFQVSLHSRLWEILVSEIFPSYKQRSIAHEMITRPDLLRIAQDKGGGGQKHRGNKIGHMWIIIEAGDGRTGLHSTSVG